MYLQLGLQAKDVITALIGLAALITSITSLWAGYLKKARLRFTLPGQLGLSYSKDMQLIIIAEIAASNVGARPGVITQMGLKLTREGEEPISLTWREILVTENIAEKGQPRKVWTSFAGFSSPVVIPKYDAKQINAGFWSPEKPLLNPGTYRLRLSASQADRKKLLSSDERSIEFSQAALDVLSKYTVADQTGIRKTRLDMFFEDETYKSDLSKFRGSQ